MEAPLTARSIVSSQLDLCTVPNHISLTISFAAAVAMIILLTQWHFSVTERNVVCPDSLIYSPFFKKQQRWMFWWKNGNIYLWAEVELQDRAGRFHDVLVLIFYFHGGNFSSMFVHGCTEENVMRCSQFFEHTKSETFFNQSKLRSSKCVFRPSSLQLCLWARIRSRH